MGCSAAVCFLSALRHCAAVLGAGGSVHHIHSCRGSEPAVGGASSAHAGARRVRSQPCSPTLRTPPQSRFSVRLDSWQWFAVARIRPAWSSRGSEIHGQQADKCSEETCEDARASSVTLGLSMDIAALRPILAGLIGAVIAAWFLRKISTDSPQFCVQRRLTEYLRDPTAGCETSRVGSTRCRSIPISVVRSSSQHRCRFSAFGQTIRSWSKNMRRVETTRASG
jgi:hypothetical protein